MKSFISAIGTANPIHITAQNKIADFMANALSMDDDEKHRQKVLYRASGISQRYSVLEDYGKNIEQYSFYPPNESLEPFPGIAHRMEIYKKEALSLCLQAIKDCLGKSVLKAKDFTHLISVSCTGMYAPGIDIEIVQALKMSTHVQRTAINFMGCYAAFNAIKVADTICKADANAKVLIVCVELCSIHFQKDKDDDNILSNALFGDGAAAMIVQAEKPQGLALSLEKFYCDLKFEGKQEMAWHIGDHGFEMKLSSYVPEMIKEGIADLAAGLLNSFNLAVAEIDFFAIHPGGKRILETIEQELGISKNDNRHAYAILKKYGNMSSPTILFVLNLLLSELTEADKNKNVLSFAFGPGLTLESMLLKVQ